MTELGQSKQQHVLQVSLPVTIRPAKLQDIVRLEWHGQFHHLRNLFRRSYREQQAGRRLLLIAAVDEYPIARLFLQWVSSNLTLADGHTRAYLYSFQVHEMLQGRGIGTALLQEAEARIRARHYREILIAVAKENPRAQMLYQRLGYRVIRDDPGEWNYVDHNGVVRYVAEPCWIMEKRLLRARQEESHLQ